MLELAGWMIALRVTHVRCYSVVLSLSGDLVGDKLMLLMMHVTTVWLLVWVNSG